MGRKSRTKREGRATVKDAGELFGELLTGLRKSFGKEYCMHPAATRESCAGGIIRAHTIQRAGGLSAIARNGHVYAFNLQVTATSTSDCDLLSPTLLGIGRASTFTGFCNKHDTEVFAPLETVPFSWTPAQVFLLHYRAICLELFKKRAQLDNVNRILELKAVDGRLHDHAEGVKRGYHDLLHAKAILDQLLLAEDYRAVFYYGFRFDEPPTIASIGATFAEVDFIGRRLRTPEEIVNTPHLPLLAFTLTPLTNGGLALFSWVGHDSASVQFAYSLRHLPDDEVPDALVRYAFEFLENTYMAPQWWEQLSLPLQQSLVRRMNGSVELEYFRPSDSLYRGTDLNHYTQWSVVERRDSSVG